MLQQLPVAFFSSRFPPDRNERGWKAPGKGLHVWPSRTRTSPSCRCLHHSPCQSTAPCLCMDPVLAPNADLKTESFLRSLKSILRLLSPKNAKYLSIYCSLRFLCVTWKCFEFSSSNCLAQIVNTNTMVNWLQLVFISWPILSKQNARALADWLRSTLEGSQWEQVGTNDE